MSKLTLTITKAGMDRFTAAQLGEDIDLSISSVGLTDTAFVVAPTLTALPGQFRKVTTISGDQVGDNIVHMTIRDDADATYSVRGFGLYLADGTLFAVYGQADRIFTKAAPATFYAAIDIVFPTGDIGDLRFGDTNFLNPPATTLVKGVVRLATVEEGDAGTSAACALTPLDLRRAVPIGLISLWFGAVEAVPPGWAICDGSTVNRSDGAGKVTTPDLRDRVAVGAGGQRATGTTFGDRLKVADTSPAGDHTHTGKADAHSHRFQATDGAAMAVVYKNDTAGGGTGKAVASLTIDGQTAASDAPLTINAVEAHRHSVTVDVTQPSMALYYIMKV